MPVDFNEKILNFAGKVNEYLEKIAKNWLKSIINITIIKKVI